MRLLLSSLIILPLLVACGNPSGVFELSDGRTVTLSDQCADSDGRLYEIGDEWSDGCNEFQCVRDPRSNQPRLKSTLKYCPSL